MIRTLLSLAAAWGLLFGAARAADTHTPNPPKKHPQKSVEEVFKARDLNGDGKITLEEFTAKAKDNKDLTAKLQKRFQILDANHDGAVTLDEFKAAREKMAKKHHHAHAAKRPPHQTPPATPPQPT